MTKTIKTWLECLAFGWRSVPFTSVALGLYVLVAYYLFLPLEYGVGSDGRLYTSISGTEILNITAMGIIALTLVLLAAILLGLTQIFSLFQRH